MCFVINPFNYYGNSLKKKTAEQVETIGFGNLSGWDKIYNILGGRKGTIIQDQLKCIFVIVDCSEWCGVIVSHLIVLDS